MKTISTLTSTKNLINPHIEAIRNSDNDGIKFIYREFFSKAKLCIIRLGGRSEDAEDIFQEALIVIYEKIQQNTLPMITSFGAYFMGICKYLWKSNSRRKYRREVTGMSQEYQPDETDISANIIEQDEKVFFQSKLDLLPKDGQKVLQLYFEGNSMKQIAHKMGYGSAAYAKKKKAVVKKKLIHMMKLDPVYKELKQA